MRLTSHENETSNLDASIAEDVARVETTEHVNASDNVSLQDFARDPNSQRLHGVQCASHDVDDEDFPVPLPQEEEKPERPSILPRPSSIARHASFLDQDEAPLTSPSSSPPKDKAGPVAWRDLPNKSQLAILTLARLSEPLTQTSLQAYMFYQLRSFDPSLPTSSISAQAGMMQGSFTAAQFLTAILWGRLADTERVGRKRVLLIGLAGTGFSCLGFGFSRTFWQAMVCRTLGGALNGNVGVMRTMISEIIKEKRFQSRAFLLLPMCFNIGVIIGPVLGGLLSDPVKSYPRLFGNDSLLGGVNGVYWLKHWPYALPNITSAAFLFISAMGVIFGLKETHEAIRDQPDLGLRIGSSIANAFRRLLRLNTHHYSALNAEDDLTSPRSSSRLDSYELESNLLPKSPIQKQKPRRKLPLSRIWTRNVLCTLLCHSILALHIGTFNNLWFIHLSAPRFDPEKPFPPPHTRQSLPFNFTGGLGMPPRSVGFAMAVLGVIGISLQLLVYPAVNARLGTLRSFRYSLCLFPLAYTLTPYLSIIHSSLAPPRQASGILVWLALSGVLLIQVIGRTFALPATIILINNCSPHPSVLGTIHGIAQSVSSASRTVGPLVGGWGYGKGLQVGVVGAVWWALAGVAGVGWVLSGLVREGDGHEIWLEGEREEEGGN
ncbi:major facilitator superfamily domain-containing protein [Usnea florida]